MTDLLEITPEMQREWVRAKSRFGVPLRRPEADETPLSTSEIVHGIRKGVFAGTYVEYEPDASEIVYVLEKRV